MNTPEGLDLRVPTPTGDLTLPLDNGLKTKATWFTADASFDLTDDWHLQNTAQVMQNDQEWNALLPFNALTAQDFVTGPDLSGGARVPRGKHGSVHLHQPLRRHGNAAPVRHPERPGCPRWRVACREADLGSPGPASVEAELRKAFSFASGATSPTTPRTITGSSPTSSPTCGTTRASSTWSSRPREARPVNVTKNGFRNFLNDYAQRIGPGYGHLGRSGRGDPAHWSGSAPMWASGSSTTTSCRTRRNVSTFDLDGDSDHDVRQRALRQQQLPALQPEYHRLVGSRGAQLQAERTIVDLWLGRPRLQDAGARRVPECHGPGAGGPLRLARGAVGRGRRQIRLPAELGVTVNGFYTKLKNIVGQGAEVDPVTGARPGSYVRLRDQVLWSRGGGGSSARWKDFSSSAAAPSSRPSWERGSIACVGRELAGVPRTIGNLAAIYSPPRASRAAVQGRLALGRLTLHREPAHPGRRHQAAVLQLLQLRRGLRDSERGSQGQRRPAERVPEQGTGRGQPAAGGRWRQLRSSWLVRCCLAGCRRRSSTTSEGGRPSVELQAKQSADRRRANSRTRRRSAIGLRLNEETGPARLCWACLSAAPLAASSPPQRRTPPSCSSPTIPAARPRRSSATGASGW